eukprot:6922142-Prymnesium_polylepis.1
MTTLSAPTERSVELPKSAMRRSGGPKTARSGAWSIGDAGLQQLCRSGTWSTNIRTVRYEEHTWW